MKTCSRCKQEKPLDAFGSKGANRRQAYCRPCQYEYQREDYAKNSRARLNTIYKARKKRDNGTHQWVYAYLKEHPCVDCSENDPVVLEFDHVEDDKQFNISEAIRDHFPLKQIQEEIQKCQVRCANCHRKITAMHQNSWKWRLQQEEDNAQV